MQLKGFIGGAYTLQSPDIECQRCVNLFPQVDESGSGKNVAALIYTPGLKSFYNFGAVAGTPRGTITTASAGRCFFVSAGQLFELFSDGTISTGLGSLLSSGITRVGMAENGQQLLITDGPNAYSYDLTSGVFAVLSDFPATGPLGTTLCTYQDSYFIVNKGGSNQFFISGNFTTTFDPADFASAEGSPDNILNIISDHREVWIFGDLSIEVWFNSGDPNFPFARIDGAFIPHGIAARFSPIVADNTLAWLGKDTSGNNMFWKANGYTPTRISTHAIEQAISRYPTTSDCTGFAYQQDGHTFGVWNFPSGNATWVYDFATGLWHERAYTALTGLLERGRPELYTRAFDKHIVTDYDGSKIYEMTPTALNDNGRVITKMRVSPYVSSDLLNLFISRLWLDIQTGNVASGNPEPQAMLQWSDDGGQTWSNEHWIGLGAIGQSKKRAIWRRLGKTRERVFRVKITDDVPVAITDAFIDVEGGTS